MRRGHPVSCDLDERPAELRRRHFAAHLHRMEVSAEHDADATCEYRK